MRNPILWTRASEALFQTIKTFSKPGQSILEVGSGTGHITYLLAKRGNLVTLNDIRVDVLQVSKEKFRSHGVPLNIITGDLFNIKEHFDFIWNSGLIQCLEGKSRERLIAHLESITPQLLLIYPDTESDSKIRGANKHKIPGVDDAIEYPIGDIPVLMNKYFYKVCLGELPSKKIGLPYKMYYIFGDNQK